MRKLLIIILILATITVYARVFSDGTKPRKLTPAERRDSVTEGRRKGKG